VTEDDKKHMWKIVTKQFGEDQGSKEFPFTCGPNHLLRNKAAKVYTACHERMRGLQVKLETFKNMEASFHKAHEENHRLQKQIDYWEDNEIKKASCCSDMEQDNKRLTEQNQHLEASLGLANLEIRKAAELLKECEEHVGARACKGMAKFNPLNDCCRASVLLKKIQGEG